MRITVIKAPSSTFGERGNPTGHRLGGKIQPHVKLSSAYKGWKTGDQAAGCRILARGERGRLSAPGNRSPK